MSMFSNQDTALKKIENNFKNVDFFSGIEEGLKEAIAYERGNAKARTFARKRSLPEINVRAERESLAMTQKSFASILGVLGNGSQHSFSDCT